VVIGGTGGSSALSEAAEFGWTVLSGIGLVFFLVGALDIVLAWYPLGFGSPAWEFGTVTLSLNGLPTPALGLAMGLASGVALGRRWQVRITAVVFVGLAVAVVVGAVVWVTNVPLALESTEDPLGRLGVQRVVIKAAVQILLYPVAFVWLGVAGWRRVSQAHVAPKPEGGGTAF
jgi:hypothetical protein